ncbi:hypothetical protein LCGC14_2501500, partial [marine sediment metagenome]
VYQCNDEWVGGYPMWDVFRAMHEARDLIRGRYEMLVHKETVFGLDYLANAVQWLREAGEPLLALGNLTRLESWEAYDRLYRAYSDQDAKAVEFPLSSRLRALLAGDDVSGIASFLAESPSMAWSSHRSTWYARRKAQRWLEDIYFARRDWIKAIRFYERADRMICNDIYDVMADVMETLVACRGNPAVAWMPRETGCAYHLWHEKRYFQYEEAVRQWFTSDAARWEGTNYLDTEKMKRCHTSVTTGEFTAVYRHRRHPQGPVGRYMLEFYPWAQQHREALAAAATGDAQAIESLAQNGASPSRAMGEEFYNDLFRRGGHVGEYHRTYDYSIYRAVYDIVLAHLQTESPESVLEIGCGSGTLASRIVTLPGLKRYRGIDFSREGIKLAVGKCVNGDHTTAPEFILGDIREAEHYGDSWSCIVATEVLEHLDDDLAVVGMVPAGALVLLTLPDFHSPGHVRTYPDGNYIRARFAGLLDFDDVRCLPWGPRGQDSIYVCKA